MFTYTAFFRFECIFRGNATKFWLFVFWRSKVGKNRKIFIFLVFCFMFYVEFRRLVFFPRGWNNNWLRGFGVFQVEPFWVEWKRLRARLTCVFLAPIFEVICGCRMCHCARPNLPTLTVPQSTPSYMVQWVPVPYALLRSHSAHYSRVSWGIWNTNREHSNFG